MVSLCSRWAEGYSGRQGDWGLTCFCCSTLFQVSQDLDLDMMQLKLFVSRLSAALSSVLQRPTIFIYVSCFSSTTLLNNTATLFVRFCMVRFVWIAAIVTSWQYDEKQHQEQIKTLPNHQHHLVTSLIMCLKSRHTCYNLDFLRFLYLLHPKIYLGWKAKDDAATLIPSNPFHTPGFLKFFFAWAQIPC